MLKTLPTLWFPNGSQERTNLANLLSMSLKQHAKVFQLPISQPKRFPAGKSTKFVKIMKRRSSGFQNSKVSKTWLASHDQHFYHNGVLYEIFRKLIDLSSAQQKELNCQNRNYLPKVALEIYVKKKNGYTLIKSQVNCKDWTIFLRGKKEFLEIRKR